MKRLLKPIALWLATLIVVAAVLLFFEADLLWKVQQHNVFLNTSAFFHQMMAVPGGMLSYLAAYFSQHFYYPWVGVILICCWWLLLMWLTKRTFNIPNKWTVLTLIPVAILLVANMDMGYWIYLIKLPGYFYVATIGTTAATALIWAFRCLPEKMWVRVAYIILVTLVGYPLMGVYALAAVALMAVMSWRLSPSEKTNTRAKQLKGNSNHWASCLSLTIVALLSIILIPHLYYRFVYYGTNLIDIYRTAIPSFTVSEHYPNYYIPYYALAICFLLMAITYRRERTGQLSQKSPIIQNTPKNEKSAKAQKSPNNSKAQKSNHTKNTPITSYILPGATLIIIAGLVYHFWYKDANFHHELRMQRCVEQADWEGVIEEGTKQECEPTRAIVMMHNLALGRLGRQCNEMYNFPKGSKKSNTPLPIYMFNVAGRMMLYQYGAFNECHRVCMEEGVEYGWNVEQLKDMARCAIFNKEKQAARKFLDILRHTCYYGDWADHMEKLLNDPKQLSNDKETGPITHMMHYNDKLDAVEGYVEKSLMNSLAEQDADDLNFQEQAVLAALWTRNPALFWPRFEHYVELKNSGNIPRIFQEAAWLFANMEGQEGLDEWELAPGVKESFNAFMQLMQQYSKSHDGYLRQSLYERFGTTYYFEYFFLKDITYY